MKRFLFLISALFFTVSSYAQINASFYEFEQRFPWEKSPEKILKKYRSRILETSADSDVYMLKNVFLPELEGRNLTGSSYLYFKDGKIPVLVYKLETLNQSDDSFDHVLLQRSVRSQWGQEDWVFHSVLPTVFGLDESISDGTVDLRIWRYGNATVKVLIRIPRDNLCEYMLLVTKDMKSFEYVSHLAMDYEEYLTDHEPQIDIDPHFFDTFRLGERVDDQEIIHAISKQTSLSEEYVVQKMGPYRESVNSRCLVSGNSIILDGFGWENTVFSITNSMLSSLVVSKSMEFGSEEFHQHFNELLNYYSELYGKPSTLVRDFYANWRGRGERQLQIICNESAISLHFTDNECKSSIEIDNISPRSIPRSFLKSLTLQEPVSMRDVRSAFYNATTSSVVSSAEYCVKCHDLSPRTKEYSINHDVYFAGSEWDYVTIHTVDGVMSSIEFTRSSLSEDSIDSSFDYWKTTLLKKYGLFKYGKDAQLSMEQYGWNTSDDENLFVSLMRLYGESKGGEMRYYLNLKYQDLSLEGMWCNVNSEGY